MSFKISADTTITNASIVLPVELRGSERDFLFTTTTNIAANGNFFSPVYDGVTVSNISGFVSASTDGTLFIQESDDQATWYTTFSQPITASTSDTISSTTYNAATSFSKNLVSRFVRIVYVNGATAQTRFALSAYTTI